MSEGTKRHIFGELVKHQQQILDDLSLLILDFSKLPTEKAIKKAVDITEEIRKHFGREDLLIDSVQNHPDVKNDLIKYEENKSRINKSVAEILVQGDDRDACLGVLKKLSGDIRVFSEFEELRLHKKIGRYTSAKDLERAAAEFDF